MAEKNDSHEKKRRRKRLAKTEVIGFKVTKREKELVDEFCDQNEITIADLMREAMWSVIKNTSVEFV